MTPKDLLSDLMASDDYTNHPAFKSGSELTLTPQDLASHLKDNPELAAFYYKMKAEGMERRIKRLEEAQDADAKRWRVLRKILIYTQGFLFGMSLLLTFLYSTYRSNKSEIDKQVTRSVCERIKSCTARK